MEAFKIVLTVIFIVVSIALTVIVLMQEGKSAGLGAISGAAETYWGRNKGRSMEGKLEKATKYLVIGFLVIAVLLNIQFKSANSDKNSNSSNQNTTTSSGAASTSNGTTGGAAN